MLVIENGSGCDVETLDPLLSISKNCSYVHVSFSKYSLPSIMNGIFMRVTPILSASSADRLLFVSVTTAILGINASFLSSF